MATRAFQIVATIAAIAFVGTATLAVVAAGSGGDGQDGGFMQQLHRLGQSLHGGGGHHDQMGQLIEQLELTPDQLRRFEKIHEIVGSYGRGGHESMLELHEELVTQFERGEVGTAEIRRTIDGHVEQIRGMAYAVTDELVSLVNELDETQRGILLEHLQGARAEGHGH